MLKLASFACLAGCGANDTVAQKRVFVVSSDEALVGGAYTTPSPNGEVVSDVDGNLVEDVMACGFVDVRVVDDPERLHGSGFEIWIPGTSMSNLQQGCLRKKLPRHARLSGPIPEAEAMKRVGL